MVTPVSQLTVGAIAVFVYQQLKRSSWFPLVSEESSKTVKWVWAGIFAWGQTLGIHFTFDPATHVLAISGLTALGILQGAWSAIQQFAIQEGWYQVVVNKPALPSATPAAPATGVKP
jgi:hypothetical protein